MRNLNLKYYSIKKNNLFNAVKIYKNLHTIETQLKIKDDNKHKAGIYCVFNIINGQFYIGSAITNRINTRFRNNCIHLTGNKYLKNAINKYGLNNFYFMILEYYPGIIFKDNLKKSHYKLIELETEYIAKYKPEYNILTYGYSSLGYQHNKETILKMNSNYSEERNIRITYLNKNRIYTEEDKLKFRNAILKRYDTQPNLKLRFSEAGSKPVILFQEDGLTIHSEYTGIRQMAKTYGCCHKTINKHIANYKIFKNIG